MYYNYENSFHIPNLTIFTLKYGSAQTQQESGEVNQGYINVLPFAIS